MTEIVLDNRVTEGLFDRVPLLFLSIDRALSALFALTGLLENRADLSLSGLLESLFAAVIIFNACSFKAPRLLVRPLIGGQIRFAAGNVAGDFFADERLGVWRRLAKLPVP